MLSFWAIAVRRFSTPCCCSIRFLSTQTGTTSEGDFSITVGVPFDDAKWFRGRETQTRAISRCPDESCCRRPPAEAAQRWEGKAWPSARVHRHMFSPLPRGAFPGVDDSEVFAFLDRHAAG